MGFAIVLITIFYKGPLLLSGVGVAGVTGVAGAVGFAGVTGVD
jgi:hypothetical protein